MHPSFYGNTLGVCVCVRAYKRHTKRGMVWQPHGLNFVSDECKRPRANLLGGLDSFGGESQSQCVSNSTVSILQNEITAKPHIHVLWVVLWCELQSLRSEDSLRALGPYAISFQPTNEVQATKPLEST